MSRRICFSIRLFFVISFLLGLGIVTARAINVRSANEHLIRTVRILPEFDLVREGSAFYCVFEYPDIDASIERVFDVGLTTSTTTELTTLLEDPNARIRRRSAYAIGQLISVKPQVRFAAEGALMKASDDPDFYAREEILGALHRISGKWDSQRE